MSFKPGETIKGAGKPGQGYPPWIPSVNEHGRLIHIHLRNITIDGNHYTATVDHVEPVHPTLTHAEEASLYGGHA